MTACTLRETLDKHAHHDSTQTHCICSKYCDTRVHGEERTCLVYLTTRGDFGHHLRRQLALTGAADARDAVRVLDRQFRAETQL